MQTMFTTNCERHDIVLLPIPFTDLTSRKVRPAVVIGFGSFSGDLFVVPVTSQLANADFPLADWKGAGLNVASGIKAQLATVETAGLEGSRAPRPADSSTLDDQLRRWLKLPA